MATEMSVLPLVRLTLACLNLSCIQKKVNVFSLPLLFFSASYLFGVYHPINSLIQTITAARSCKQTHTHKNTLSRCTQINRPWQGCVSRWQHWRGHGHRAVWAVAPREVDHPDTWRRTRTAQVPPWWCGLVTTVRKTGNTSCYLTRLHYLNLLFDLSVFMSSHSLEQDRLDRYVSFV